jgi:hypothetical protein
MNLDDYDGVTSLRLEIKNRLNKTSHTTQADYIADGCEALGFKKRLRSNGGSPAENVAILKWLLENKTATRNKSKGQVMTISATGIAVNLILGVQQNNRVTFELAKRFAARDGIKRTGKKLTDYISDNKQAAIEFIEAQNKARQLARDDIMATGSAKPLADYVEQVKQNDDVNVLPVKQSTTKTRNKTKRESRFNQFTAIAFSVTGKTGRQHISLEPEYMKALELIAPDNRNKWLSDTVADYIAKNGIESTTRIVKASIVNALIERVKK